MSEKIKKGAERLDTTSTDALHWAECFSEQVEINGGQPPEVDFLVSYFANYWAAVHDPLSNRIEQLEALLKKSKCQYYRNPNGFRCVDGVLKCKGFDDLDCPDCAERDELLGGDSDG